jgi:DNA replication licensing factor MCM6
MLGTRDLT